MIWVETWRKRKGKERDDGRGKRRKKGRERNGGKGKGREEKREELEGKKEEGGGRVEKVNADSISPCPLLRAAPF